MTRSSRELKAVTLDSSSPSKVPRGQDDEINTSDEPATPTTGGWFNFEDWYRNDPLIYKPNFSGKYFSHHGRWFHWSSSTRANKYGEGQDRFILIRCFGRSTRPIKDLLSEVKSFTHRRMIKTTEVFRSADGGRWIRQTVRSSRPMGTVSLDQQQMAKIILDMNEYLRVGTACWYAVRGIPYRRGYLFYGPPGTGKTSLSFALAGLFGLGIYCISLSEADLTELELATLFNSLPERCIVLLDDVDNIGLCRNANSEGDSGITRSRPISVGSEASAACNSTASIRHKITRKNRVSLAGLLNIIDGAASQEGRVLIMTTNCPERLDPALIRPGRVDMQIHFTLATRAQIRSIFMRMYSTEPNKQRLDQATHCTARKTSGDDDNRISIQDEIPFNMQPYIKKVDRVSATVVQEIAQQFAEKIPELRLSPAEIQGFLLEWKDDPRGALSEIDAWIRNQLKESAGNEEEQERTCVHTGLNR
ncbi:P-loop containing nucleoside triphosphate hydrolase protein [Phaeosphaeriaceae sp. PMI808]|nr:P-loop containing nucleoside triphosphate hydrolase protein [Phaeosphaeriaceae sp. PMI808]